MNRPAPWRRLGRLGRCAALGMLLGVGILFAGCYYVAPPPPPPYAAPAPPPGAILVPGQWVWTGAAWVWRPPYWASPILGHRPGAAPPPGAAPAPPPPPGPPPPPRS